MKNNPLVSIIIPVYNEEKYLDFCLSSIVNQSYKDIETIVVDDGSTDKSFKIAKRHPVKILQQDHVGPGAARNLGAKNADGEILAFLDADMKYDKKYIEKIIEPIIKGKAIGTFTKEEFVANPHNLWSRCWSINSGLPPNRRLPENYSDTESAFRAILKEYFIKAGGFEVKEGYTDDSSLARKLKIKAENASGAVCYHYNPSTLTEVFYSARWIGRGRVFEPTFKNFLRFLPLNSIRVSLKYLLNGAPPTIIPFKLIFDLGVFIGIFTKNGKTFK